jgi:hypothetical protein
MLSFSALEPLELLGWICVAVCVDIDASFLPGPTPFAYLELGI